MLRKPTSLVVAISVLSICVSVPIVTLAQDIPLGTVSIWTTVGARGINNASQATGDRVIDGDHRAFFVNLPSCSAAGCVVTSLPNQSGTPAYPAPLERTSARSIANLAPFIAGDGNIAGLSARYLANWSAPTILSPFSYHGIPGEPFYLSSNPTFLNVLESKLSSVNSTGLKLLNGSYRDLDLPIGRQQQQAAGIASTNGTVRELRADASTPRSPVFRANALNDNRLAVGISGSSTQYSSWVCRLNANLEGSTSANRCPMLPLPRLTTPVAYVHAHASDISDESCNVSVAVGWAANSIAIEQLGGAQPGENRPPDGQGVPVFWKISRNNEILSTSAPIRLEMPQVPALLLGGGSARRAGAAYALGVSPNFQYIYGYACPSVITHDPSSICSPFSGENIPFGVIWKIRDSINLNPETGYDANTVFCPGDSSVDCSNSTKVVLAMKDGNSSGKGIATALDIMTADMLAMSVEPISPPFTQLCSGAGCGSLFARSVAEALRIVSPQVGVTDLSYNSSFSKSDVFLGAAFIEALAAVGSLKVQQLYSAELGFQLAMFTREQIRSATARASATLGIKYDSTTLETLFNSRTSGESLTLAPLLSGFLVSSPTLISCQ